MKNIAALRYVCKALQDAYTAEHNKQGTFLEILDWILTHQEEILAFIAAIMIFF